MYEELVKRLLRTAQTLAEFVAEETAKMPNTIFGEAADAIDELSREVDIDNAALTAMDAAMPRWIPVTERLPETPGEYMVAYHPCYWDRVHDEIKVGLDSFRGKTSWAKKKYQRVTHWMPLPEPPKEEA